MSYGMLRTASTAAGSTLVPAGARPFWIRMPGPTTRVDHAVGVPLASSVARKTL
jgi:hypothetical protein